MDSSSMGSRAPIARRAGWVGVGLGWVIPITGELTSAGSLAFGSLELELSSTAEYSIVLVLSSMALLLHAPGLLSVAATLSGWTAA